MMGLSKEAKACLPVYALGALLALTSIFHRPDSKLSHPPTIDQESPNGNAESVRKNVRGFGQLWTVDHTQFRIPYKTLLTTTDADFYFGAWGGGLGIDMIDGRTGQYLAIGEREIVKGQDGIIRRGMYVSSPEEEGQGYGFRRISSPDRPLDFSTGLRPFYEPEIETRQTRSGEKCIFIQRWNLP